MDIIDALIKKSKITKEVGESLKKEVRDSNRTEEEIILEKKILDEGSLFELKGDILNVPFLKNAEATEIPDNILMSISEESARHYKIIPLSKKDNFLRVGMVNPADIKAREALMFLARQGRFPYKIFLITNTALDTLLRQYRNLREEVGAALEALEAEIGIKKKVEIGPIKPVKKEKISEEAPVIKIVAVILRHAVEGRASDIHIEPTKHRLRVRFRLDGILYPSLFLPLRIHPAMIARIKILSNLRIDETRIPQDGRFSAKVGERPIDFRVSTFPTHMGEKIAIRVLDPTAGLKTYKGIGLTGKSLKILEEGAKKPYGLILATGPTGCGKTTTLYAVLQLLNKEQVNVLTLEDPIEYFIEGVNQSQIRPDIHYDFAQGLRHMVRQDPDIIMVGEIRDEESASLVTQAALTGHIVLSTIHTTGAIGVIPRLIDMGIKPFLVPPTLNVALSQRLVRQLCPYCKKKIKAPEVVKNLILKTIDSLPPSVKKEVKVPDPLYVYKAAGCKKCHFKGFIGRSAIFEILRMTDRLANIILEEEPSEEKIAEEAKRQGMVTMRQDGILKVLKGEISIEEVLRVTAER